MGEPKLTPIQKEYVRIATKPGVATQADVARERGVARSSAHAILTKPNVVTAIETKRSKQLDKAGAALRQVLTLEKRLFESAVPHKDDTISWGAALQALEVTQKVKHSMADYLEKTGGNVEDHITPQQHDYSTRRLHKMMGNVIRWTLRNPERAAARAVKLG